MSLDRGAPGAAAFKNQKRRILIEPSKNTMVVVPSILEESSDESSASSTYYIHRRKGSSTPLGAGQRISRQIRKKTRKRLKQRNSDSISSNECTHFCVKVDDDRDILWTKLQDMSKRHLRDLWEIFGLVMRRLATEQSNPGAVKNCRYYLDVLGRMMSYLIVSKEKLAPSFTHSDLEVFERQTDYFLRTFRRGVYKEETDQHPNTIGGSVRCSDSENEDGIADFFCHNDGCQNS